MAVKITLACLIVNEIGLFLLGAFAWAFGHQNGRFGLDYVEEVGVVERE